MKFFTKNKKTEIDFEQERREKLSEIGLCLQEFREDKNLSLEIISNQIHIPIRLIQALESANTKELPEPIYTRELLRKYANYLGLRGDDFANHFNIEANKNDVKIKKSHFSFHLSQIKLNPVSQYIIYILLMFFAVKSLGNFLETSPVANNYVPKVEKNQAISTTNPSVQNNSTSKAIPVIHNQEKSPPKPKEVTVNITVQDECWVKITVDGKNEFEGVLNKGEQRKWTAKEKLTIRAGNAGGVLVAFNEQKGKTLGKRGQVAEMTFELPSNS